MFQEKIVLRFSEISECINKTSRKYLNFREYYIEACPSYTDSYIIYLVYDEQKNVKEKQKILQTYLLKDYYVKDINELEYKTKNEFLNYIGYQFFISSDKKYNVLLNFEIDKSRMNFIPTVLKQSCVTGAWATSYCVVTFNIYSYHGRPYYTSTTTSIQIFVKNIHNRVYISYGTGINESETVFKRHLNSVNNQYVVREYSDSYKCDEWHKYGLDCSQ